MSQEAIMIAVDNSDFMRNGDYNPTRHQAQIDAFNYLCNAKKRMNVENTCGLVTLANYQVVCTLTTDMSKLHSKVTLVELSGEINFCTSVRVAQLALRHRQSRNQKPRIVVFVGSPLRDDSDEDLVKLGKKLKKEKVNIDVISFGESEENQEKLANFIETVNGKENTGLVGSHLVTIPPGASLQDSLRTSPILMTEDGGLGGSGPGAGAGGFGMEEIDDPDLLYALRVSMEDQRMQQERAAGLAGTADDSVAVPAVGGGGSSGGQSTEEDMLRQAMAASMAGSGAVGAGATVTGSDNSGSGVAAAQAAATEMVVDLSSMTEEQQIEYAMRMSLLQEELSSGAAAVAAGEVESREPESGTSMEVEQQEKFDVVDDPGLVDSVLERMDEDDDKDDSEAGQGSHKTPGTRGDELSK